MSADKQWVTIKEAMTLAHRGKTVVYGWAKDGRVRSRRGARGSLEVHGLDVLRAEADARPGRPGGVAATR